MQCLKCFCRVVEVCRGEKMDPDNVRIPINPAGDLSFSAGDIVDVSPPEHPTCISITAVLHFCKSKIVRPYLRLLSIMGLRPLPLEPPDTCSILEVFSHYYTLQVIIVMIVGYVLQYMACFRRDRGFRYKVLESDATPLFQSTVETKHVSEQMCEGSVLFSFIIPSLLHLIAYLHAVAVFRSSDDDQLPSLMERVFISSANLSDSLLNQKRIIKTLWTFVLVSAFWMLLSFVSVNIMMAQATISFKWLERSPARLVTGLKVLLIVCTLFHDIVQATIISNYCLQAQLLTSYAGFLREKLIQCRVDLMKWMRDIEDFRKILKYFNEEMAPAVCIFTFINFSCGVSGIIWLLNYDHIDKDTSPIIGVRILNVCLWIAISVAPFIQAARLTSSCEKLCNVGHEVRIKPFVHQDTPGYELDSVLLYTSTLKVSARLFAIPIYAKHLCILVLFLATFILILGQTHYLNT